MKKYCVCVPIILIVISTQHAGFFASSYFKCNIGLHYKADKKSCMPCTCDTVGAKSPICNPLSGLCYCKIGYMGPKCNLCTSDYYLDPLKKVCLPCACNKDGSKSIECGSLGQCRCKPNIGGRKCDYCTKLRLNFDKECTEGCPEMYNAIADEFGTFLKALDELEEYVDESAFGINSLQKLTAKIKRLKHLLLKKPSIVLALDRLLDVIRDLQEQIRSYVDKSQDVNKLMRIMRRILNEYHKIMRIIKNKLDTCLDACKNIELYEKSRDLYLTELHNLQYIFGGLIEEEAALENKLEKLKNKAELNKKWSLQIFENVTAIEEPTTEQAFFDLENNKLKELMTKLDELKKDVHNLADTYVKTAKLQNDYVLQNVKALNSIVGSPIHEINTTITNILRELNNYGDILINITLPNHLSTERIFEFQRLIEIETDKLEKYKALAEKYASDDQNAKKILSEIVAALDDLTLIISENAFYLLEADKTRRELEEFVVSDYEKHATDINRAIEYMETETMELEDDLKDIDNEMVVAHTEIAILEEVLTKLQAIKYLSEEVRKLKNMHEELDKLYESSDLCIVPPPSLS